MPLKYLFLAQYKDGTAFIQNKEDISAQDDKRSAFYDVKQDQLHTFSLIGEDNIYMVDISNGCFSINSVPFRMHDTEVTNFKLVFHRQHTHTYKGVEELSHIIVYHIGWEGVDKEGQIISRVMQIL